VGALTRLALITVAAVAAVAVAVTGVLLLGRAAPVHGVRPATALVVRASFDPPAAQFGDRVVARVVVLADRSVLDTSKLHVTEDVAPLTTLGPARVSRTTRGRLLVVSYELPTVCVTERCLAKRLRLPAARADAPRRSGGILRAETAWPVLEMRGRVTAADLAKSPPPLRGDTSAPSVTYRIAPATLSFLLDLAAALLAAAGVSVAAWQAAILLRRKRAPETRDELERALALVREAETRPPEDRRRAVGLLARLLRQRDERLAGDAGDLAWSEPKPAPDELAALAERVVREVGE
jgi:hypothetical protein